MEVQEILRGHTAVQQETKVKDMDRRENTWRQEKKAMQEEINSLKVMLHKSVTDHKDYLKEHVKTEAVGRVSYLVEKYTAVLRRLKSKSKFAANPTETEEELKALLDEIETDESCNLEDLEMSRSTFLTQAAVHKQDTGEFMTERLQWEEEKASLLQENRDHCVARLNHQKKEAYLKEDLLAVEAELQETKVSCLGQLNQQKMENQKLQNALKETEEELKTQVDQRQPVKIYHLEELEKSISTFLAQAAIHKKDTDQFMADRLQWEQEKASLLQENRDQAAIHKQDTGEFMTERLQWEQEKASLLQENRDQAAIHKQDTGEFMTERLQWEEEKASLLQENRDQAAIHKQDTGEFMTERLQWEEEKASLLQENRDQEAIHKQDTDEFMTERLQWEEEKASLLQENRDQAAIHKQDTDEFMTERLQSEEEKASLLEENRDQAAIHKQDTDEFTTERLQWEEEKAYLLQESRDYCVARLYHQKKEAYLKGDLEMSRSTFLSQAAIHKQDTGEFMTERLQWEEEKASLLQENRNHCVARLNHQKKEAYLKEDLLAVEAELQETKVSCLGQLNQQKMENQKLQNALKETEEEVKTQVDQRQQVKIYHLEELEKSISTFLAQAAIHKKDTDQFMADRLQWEQEKASLLQESRDQAAIHKQDTDEFMTERLQWEEEKASLLQEDRDQAAIHKKETDQFMADHLQWEQEKASLLQENRDSCVAQLNQKEEVDHFAAVLRNAEQHFKGFEEWREEMSSLMRDVEELKQMLQKKEQESVSKDFLAVKTQLEDLQRKVNEKKRNKWYRFCGTLFTPRRAE